MNHDLDRLSEISTVWTQVRQAHQPVTDANEQAKLALIERYQAAVYRYLSGAFRHQDTADEAFQEFALRIVEGRFQAASQSKGRFRDYLRTTLINIINDFRRRKAKHASRQVDLPELDPSAHNEGDVQFLTYWRSEILAKAWVGLNQYEASTGKPYHTVLKARVENQALSMDELVGAIKCNVRPESDLNATYLRKLIQRAREKFSDLLIEEVSHSIGSKDSEAIEQELADLQLHIYCAGRIKKSS